MQSVVPVDEVFAKFPQALGRSLYLSFIAAPG